MVSDYLWLFLPKYGLKHGIVNIPVVLPSTLNDQSNIEQTAAANEVVQIPGNCTSLHHLQKVLKHGCIIPSRIGFHLYIILSVGILIRTGI